MTGCYWGSYTSCSNPSRVRTSGGAGWAGWPQLAEAEVKGLAQGPRGTVARAPTARADAGLPDPPSGVATAA